MTTGELLFGAAEPISLFEGAAMTLDGNVAFRNVNTQTLRKKLKANGARTYQADFMALNTATNVKAKHANIIFEVTETASI